MPRKDRTQKTTSRRTWLLSALLVLMLAANWYALNHTIDITPVDAQRAPGPAVATADPAIAKPNPPPTSAELLQTVQRPLFHASRRPIEPPKPKEIPKVVEPPLPPLQAQLIGVSIANPSGPKALVRPAGDKQGTWLHVGEEVRGWRLNEIAVDRVVFVVGERRQVLPLFAIQNPRRTKVIQ